VRTDIANVRNHGNGLADWFRAAALFVPLLANACPSLTPEDNGETSVFPSKPVKDPAMWMQQAADQECSGRSNDRRLYAAENDRQFGSVQLIYNPCRFGTNFIYTVFVRVADQNGERNFCAIGTVGGSGVSQLPSGRNGYVRIETYWHWSGSEGDLTRVEQNNSVNNSLRCSPSAWNFEVVTFIDIICKIKVSRYN
jgi:hypothetical protein